MVTVACPNCHRIHKTTRSTGYRCECGTYLHVKNDGTVEEHKKNK